MTNVDIIAEALNSQNNEQSNIDRNEERLYNIVASSPISTHISSTYGTLDDAIDLAKKRNITYSSMTNGRGNVFNLSIVDYKTNETVWTRRASQNMCLIRISRIEFTHKPLFRLGKPKKKIILVDSDFDTRIIYSRFRKVELVSIKPIVSLVLADKQLAEDFIEAFKSRLYK